MPLEITRPDARRAALTRLIDYAGMFPPASLGIEDAVAGYREARTGPQAWMVDRFICPADRLIDLAAVLASTMTEDEDPWSLVVTARPEQSPAIADFVAEMSGGADIDTIETLFPEGADAAAVIGIMERFGRVTFFEVPWQASYPVMLDVLVAAREASGRFLGAKVRCGGPTAAAFPPPAVLAGFLAECRDRGLPVKATAGLHHPFRHEDAATGFTHHGFLNLLAATALAHDGAEAAVLTDVLTDADPSHFVLDVRGLTWRGRHIGLAGLTGVRRDLFVGYGSCSFEEPVHDLAALGMLPEAS